MLNVISFVNRYKTYTLPKHCNIFQDKMGKTNANKLTRTQSVAIEPFVYLDLGWKNLTININEV